MYKSFRGRGLDDADDKKLRSAAAASHRTFLQRFFGISPHPTTCRYGLETYCMWRRGFRVDASKPFRQSSQASPRPRRPVFSSSVH
jgi:hypothetical protein